MFRIYPYRTGSQSVRKLADALDAKIIKLENTRYRQRDEHTVINWGNSRTPEWMSNHILNQPSQVRRAADKLLTFSILVDAGVSIPDFTTNTDIAKIWLEEGSKIFVRHTLTGHSGEGIEVVDSNGGQKFAVQEAQRLLDEAGLRDVASTLDSEYNKLAEQEQTLPLDAPLYTRGVQNHGEYRVHVVNDEVILYQKKSRRVDEDGNVMTAEGEAADVRNLASNWVYRTGNLKRLDRIEQLAINAIKALRLDFGAVDIIMDESGDVHVLEINTAPGLGNTDTLAAYVEAFNKVTE